MGRDSVAGAVTILFGSRAGLGGAGARVLTQRNPEPGDNFGFSLAVGEISGPAGAELAVGAPGQAGAGAASVLFGGASGGLGAGAAQLFYQGIRGVGGAAERGDAMGRAFS